MQTHSKLRLALRLNAGFSTLSAVFILFTHDSLGALMGIASPILWAVAVGLGAFAGYLMFTAARTDSEKLRAESLRHSIADFAWGIASVGIVISGVLTPTGNLVLAAVALPVLGLGIAQWRALPTRNSQALAAKA